MSNKRFGYVRVSTTDQNEDRQVLELLESGIEERDIYVDKQSGRSFERTNYLALRNTILRKGDVLVVKSIDRFGRNYPNILFAIDGEVYDFNGNSCIVIGGAYSVDKYYRLARGWSWFPDEQPSEEIKAKVERVLAERNWKIDIVLSHTGPLKYEPTEVFLPMIDQSTVDKSTEVWLEQIEAKLDYERWYFAHYHTEKEVGKIRIMHNDYTMIPHEASVAAEKDMIRRMHRQAEIAEALGLLDDAPNQKNGDDIS